MCGYSAMPTAILLAAVPSSTASPLASQDPAAGLYPAR